MAIYVSDTGTSYNRKSLIKLFITTKPATYSDATCREEQCRAGAFRSVTEIWEIVKTYYPKTSLEAILRIIKELINENANVALIYCTQVNKVVLKYQTNQEREFVTRYSTRNFAKTKGVDGYSIHDYLQIINNL